MEASQNKHDDITNDMAFWNLEAASRFPSLPEAVIYHGSTISSVLPRPRPALSGALPRALVQTDWIEPDQWAAIEPNYDCKDLPDLVVGLGMHLVYSTSMLGIAKSAGRSSCGGDHDVLAGVCRDCR